MCRNDSEPGTHTYRGKMCDRGGNKFVKSAVLWNRMQDGLAQGVMRKQ